MRNAQVRKHYPRRVYAGTCQSVHCIVSQVVSIQFVAKPNARDGLCRPGSKHHSSDYQSGLKSWMTMLQLFGRTTGYPHNYPHKVALRFPRLAEFNSIQACSKEFRLAAGGNCKYGLLATNGCSWMSKVTGTPHLITQRSVVQIHPPQPTKSVGCEPQAQIPRPH